ncbi:urate hydroxylase PuuD [Bradyrhizobium sp. NP1]|uniref:urate hydroxylase PuuD n=1 Tax=Bradyrhizobium sp. NP1 TaxID=3049772 RepID=UPI0025A57090|nr:urate hydroxylase PuuD [Bradyrhizobium sp. NP1]WJR81894.1 urate hydroxylase PuuD [Bradyrhizobium sp. NP1]
MNEISPVITEWLSMAVRWLHVTAAMVWVGSSFYFTQTDMKLRSADGLPKGALGEAWQVHGGNFWHMVRYKVAPESMPRTFTWYIWESRITWLSGFALLVLVYYLQADLFLIDKSVMDLSPLAAGLFSLISLIVIWIIYDRLCRSPLGEHDVALAVVVYILLVVLSYAFTRVLSGRAAINQIGAVVGTLMVANAFFVIHPSQRRSVASLLSGKLPDAVSVAKARQRSIHNNYLTLPVILLMISNHYPLLYATRYNWLIAAIILALGPVIRHFFNSRDSGRASPWWIWLVVATGMVAIAFLSSLGAKADGVAALTTTSGSLVTRDKLASLATEIVISRCSMCHAPQPSWGTMNFPAMGVLLDSPPEISARKRQIAIVAVLSRAMPPGNITDMTAQERQILADWVVGSH